MLRRGRSAFLRGMRHRIEWHAPRLTKALRPRDRATNIRSWPPHPRPNGKCRREEFSATWRSGRGDELRRAVNRGQRSRVIDANDLADVLHAIADELNKIAASQERARLRRNGRHVRVAHEAPCRGLLSRWGSSSARPLAATWATWAAGRNLWNLARPAIDAGANRWLMCDSYGRMGRLRTTRRRSDERAEDVGGPGSPMGSRRPLERPRAVDTGQELYAGILPDKREIAAKCKLFRTISGWRGAAKRAPRGGEFAVMTTAGF
jgi:hypothetical protein